MWLHRQDATPFQLLACRGPGLVEVETLRPEDGSTQVKDIQRHARTIHLFEDMADGSKRHIGPQLDDWEGIGANPVQPGLDEAIPLPLQLAQPFAVVRCRL